MSDWAQEWGVRRGWIKIKVGPARWSGRGFCCSAIPERISLQSIITHRWWENERHKYALTVSEAVEAECGQGDPEMAARRRTFLEKATLFPVHETILKVARLLIVPGAIPEKAGVDAVHIAAAAV
jgi:hypothetical protein